MITPLPGYLLVEPIKDDDKSAGGLYLPESAQDKPNKGTVIAVSNGFWQEGVLFVVSGKTLVEAEYQKIKPGTIVYYKRWTNETVNLDGKEVLFVRYLDLLGIENE